MGYLEFFWLFFSYLLGSIPFGFLISKIYGKNILEIGWRKTSGSNVFKNVGKLAGALTGILDLAKGSLAVFGAQKLGLSLQIQVFSGVAAVIGHNWSIFIKFAGGRGIGTFIGGFLVLAPKILGFSIAPFILSALIWNSSIGTLLFLVTAIILSYYFGQFQIGGLYTVLVLAPILIKRLSPIEEIFQSDKKVILFRNRILLDNDEAIFGLRINRILKGIEKRIENSKVLKFLADTILLPPKVGWKVAKLGVKMAKKPIEFILKNHEKVVTEIGIGDLRKMMEASAKKIVLHQEKINKINVFPVADKDTGYNLAATLLGIEGVINQRKYNSISELAKDIKEGAMINARGNAGMIYTGYLIRVLDEIKSLRTIDGPKLSKAMRKGIKAAYLSIFNPVEGTILDVMKTSGLEAYKVAKKEKNIIKILEEAYKVSQKALAETKEKLEVLKQNDVVDAGALGFVKILEAWIESLKGIAPTIEIATPPIEMKKVSLKEPKYRYELQFSFKVKEKIDLELLKKELSVFGDSLDLLQLEDRVKIHIHTNQPQEVIERYKNFPEIEWRIEDMIERIKKVTKKPLGLVVGETADLPKEFLEKYQIEAVPFKINFFEKEEIPSENFYEKLKKAKKLPTSSAATFNDYLACYKKALEKFEKILVLTLPSRLSGAYSQARIARSLFRKPEKLNIFVFDCFTAEVAEGLIAMKIQELISQGKEINEVLKELKKFCPKVKLLGLIENFKYVVGGGRIKIPKILLPGVAIAQKIGIRLLFSLEDGKVKFLGLRFGKNLAKILAQEVEKRKERKEIRAAIAHAGNLRLAEELKNLLEKDFKTKVLFISPVSPVIGVHTGPGALIVGFYPL